MSMEQMFSVAGSALSAQLTRLNATASNIANASNVASSEEEAYRGKRVVFRTLVEDEIVGTETKFAGSVTVESLVDDPSLPMRMYAPENPIANADGYVFKSNVDEMQEMIELTAASRAYQSNIEVLSTAKQMMMRTLEVMKA
ncbi:MAG: flagellar basal body rod protein FlgC [Cellvibrionales bacterium TMED21]|jgi:flagellar basal-body rod protein FlgC|nr:flagellar basal body rod protein FlgC [Halieaceae bacterium]OUT67878.1 MAG: flagellar basal body rod protein FlgC [Cellvibrionales bacterium TMED21]|tara:strand:- start:2044 stop:2469 length:426 start_codon:yes stop_codon:yes gene_type:complete